MSSLPTVVLVNPPITGAQREGYLGPVIKNLYFNSPPLGITYIAAVLERDGVPVRLIDAAVEELTLTQTVDRIRASGATITGITSTTNFFGNAVNLASRLRDALPGMTILIGGPHVTTNTETAMAHTVFDIACIGEGEMTCLELVHAISERTGLESVKGIAFRREGKLIRTEPRPLIENLDDLPPPARHLLPLDKYVPQPNDGPYLPKAAMISSRGCPYPCVFCDHGTFGSRYRSLSPCRIVDEMEELVARHGIRDIAFVDSLFMINRDRVLAIVDEIQKRKLKIRWTCTVRANVADPDTLAGMKAAGCWRVRIGVEAGDERVLKLIRKEVSLDQVHEVVAAADRLNLHPKGFFMVGHIGDTKESILRSIALAKSLALTDITVQINTPLPGAPQWDLFEQYGTLVTRDLEDFSFWEPVFVPDGMTSEELEGLHRRFYRAFYFRPIIVWRHLRMLKRPSDVTRYIRALSLLIGMFVLNRRKLPSTS